MGCCKTKMKDPSTAIQSKEQRNHLKAEMSKTKLKYLVDKTTFTAEEIKGHYEQFMKSHPSGKMRLEELITEFSKLYPKGDPRPFSRLLFNIFDQNNDGHIDYIEFIFALSHTSFKSEEDWLNFVFSLYDIDSSGYITAEELLKFLKIANTLKVKGRESLDWKDKIDSIFKVYDANSDKKISYSEFLEVAKKDSFFFSQLPECGIPLTETISPSSDNVSQKSKKSSIISGLLPNKLV